MRVTRRRPSGESGVTLIELLVAIVILTVIIAPLAAALIAYLRNTKATTDRMAESHDAQIAAAYFSHDVQSVGMRDWSTPPFPAIASIELGVAMNATPYGCGSDATAVLVRFVWDDPAVGSPTLRSASYVVKDVGSERQLRRITCSPVGTVAADVVLAHNVDPATAPTVTCHDAAGIAMACDTATMPASVTLTLIVRAPGDDTPYTVTLVGQRRQT
jgi:prepilin-type N-terminal cleavage/methylation domain-containing protein